MVYGMIIYVQMIQEVKMMPKITHFSRYAVTLKKTPIFTGLFKIFISIIL